MLDSPTSGKIAQSFSIAHVTFWKWIFFSNFCMCLIVLDGLLDSKCWGNRIYQCTPPSARLLVCGWFNLVRNWSGYVFCCHHSAQCSTSFQFLQQQVDITFCWKWGLDCQKVFFSVSPPPLAAPQWRSLCLGSIHWSKLLCVTGH